MLKSISYFLLLAISIPLAVWLLATILKIMKVPKSTYERNHQATFLCRKVNGKKNLSSSEKNLFDQFIKEGIIEKTANGTWVLSEKALCEAIGIKK